MATSDFAHLRPAAERTTPAKRKADAPTFAERFLAATGKANGEPIPAAALDPGPEQPRRIRVTGADITATLKKHGRA